ncbi:unnamed protein product [Dracunculus medinensis]|uniref:SSD domain-containing protein n=1 Tax=Dracunculus medinensis TaxID=318479 RepID=A0A3P7QAF1_DRAME|nr:unnamed protein product [Dracunculus medinensis]
MAYWSLSIYGILRVKSDIVLKKLLIADSPLNQVYDMRKKYIFPEYSFVTVFVNNVGNLLKTERIERIKSLVNSFEEIPECNGPHFTQIWIREYEQYRKNMDENIDDEKERSNFYSMDDIREFLNWPENRRWGGYMKINNETNSIDNFFFIVIYHGQHLADYNERHRMLHLWRFIADKYQDLSVSVFDDGAQFIDQLEILKPLTVQSSLGTLIAMTMVCYLFMYTIPSVIIASCCTLSIFIGVFGFLTMWNITLDPLSMSTLILTIGLSVEFSAHISYHYFRNAFEINSSCKIQRMVRCFCHIGYPLFQCCISTMLYILCFLFVDSYTSEIFVKAIITVMSLGMIHAFIIMPVVLCASSRYN